MSLAVEADSAMWFEEMKTKGRVTRRDSLPGPRVAQDGGVTALYLQPHYVTVPKGRRQHQQTLLYLGLSGCVRSYLAIK